MKKIAFFIVSILVSFEIYAGTVTVNKGGGYTYKGDHWDKTSRNYNSFDSNYYRSYQTEQMKVRSAGLGVESSGAVRTNVSSQVPKKTVFRHVLNNARTYGKMGLARAGWLGLAYSLAEMALRDKGYRWDDDKGDFVRDKDDSTYIVFVVKNNALSSPPQPITDKQYDQFCALKNHLGQQNDCQFLGYVKSIAAGEDLGLSYCRTLTFDDGRLSLNGDSFGSNRVCAAQNGFWISDQRINIVKYVDVVPITQSEFDEIVEPIADANPSKWVESSKPSEDADVPGASKPKVTVFDGEIAQSPPYTDPTTGKAQQTRWEFKTPTNGEPTVSEFIIPRPDLTPNSPEAPAVDGKDIPDDVPDDDNPADGKDKDGDKDKEQQEQPDLCEQHPDILACDKQPQKPELDEFPEIPTETVNLKFTPDNVFPSEAVCPAPVTFNVFAKEYAFSLEPACDLARSLKAFIIAMAYLMAAFFVVRTIQSEI